MRVVALHLLLLLAIYLHVGGAVQAENKNSNPVIYYYHAVSPNVTAYVELLETLRARLTSGSHAHGIPILRRPADVVTEDRFLRVQLVNGRFLGGNITVIIDVVNVNVVGYLRPYTDTAIRPTFYFFTNTASQTLNAFPHFQYQRSPLGFSNNYVDLGRRDIQLGHAPLDRAIDQLFYRHSQRSAFLVIIQMLAEAAKIRYVEAISVQDRWSDSKAISVQDRWSDLSEQIQWSGDHGVFSRTIEIRSTWHDVVPISNVASVFRDAPLALLLYKCHNGGNGKNNNIIRMPVTSTAAAVGDDERCPLVEPTTNIIGLEGLCVDVRDGSDHDGNPIQLWPCGNALPKQLWTFKSDGTIRSLGKCLVPYSTNPGAYVMLFTCSGREAQQWRLIQSGTFMNPWSGLVLATESAMPGTTLTMAEDNNSTSQAWNARNNSQQIVRYYISGLREMCLQSDRSAHPVRLVECAFFTELRQLWAIMDDTTIRPFMNRSHLCMTSSIRENIILARCQGRGDQRWTFMADGTILNPNARLVMDVRSSFVSLQEVFLYQPTGNRTQQWLAF